MLMTHPRTRSGTLAGAASLAALVLALVLPEAGSHSAAADGSCGLTTLSGTIVRGSDGRLRCGPGRALVVREDLADASPARTTIRDPLMAFLALPDPHLVDEESPLRTEWADECGGVSSSDSFRPHETLIPALVNAHVKAASELASDPSRSPAVHTNYAFAVQLGDATDNMQTNELRWMIDLLNGGKLVNPDSGKDGYEGVQNADPAGGDPRLASPVDGMSLRDLGNEPFWAPGLRAGAVPIPWFTTLGNHDVKVQGRIPNDSEAWRTFAAQWATGSAKITDLPASERERACEDPGLLADPDFWTGIASNPGSTKVVTADAGRALLERKQWIDEHTDRGGTPTGHGFDRDRCRDDDGKLLARGCFAWTQEPFRFIVLDTAAAEGEEDGNIDEEQFRWLRRELIANTTRYYTADDPPTRVATESRDRLTVVFSHHGTDALGNGSAPQGEEVRSGEDLEALMLRFPNVILHATGHAHRNRVVSHENEKSQTSYWEIATAGPVDWPSESRSIEIADNHDGTLSIFGVLFDAAAPADPRSARWGADPTDEKKLGGDRTVNEDWLASAAREIAFNDPQVGHGASVVGGKDDRNVELVLRHPLGVTQPKTPPIQPPAGGFPGQLPSFGGFAPPGFPPGGGFPGGAQLPGVPPFPTPQPPGQPEYPTTQKGMGAPGTGNAGRVPARAGLLSIAAVGGAWWLMQARVRRYMVGI